ncbi:MAG: ATP-binding protein [Planctomycetota bacterium]
MSPGPTRLGLWFALTLALPAAFAGAWLWLEPGGLVQRARDDERKVAELALQAAEQATMARLRVAAEQAPVRLQLDERRHVVAPFAAAPTAAAPEVTIAERAAIARLDVGDAEAKAFFAHAAGDGSLTPIGWLRYAEAIAVQDVPAARELLRTARQRFAAARVGPLPFVALALCAELRLLGGGPRAGLSDDLVAALHDVPASSVGVVLDEVESLAPGLLGDRADALRTAAAVALQYTALAVPTTPSPGPQQSAIVPLDPEHCAALPNAQLTAARDDAFAEVAARDGSVMLLLTASEQAPSRRVELLGETWFAAPANPVLTSALLSFAARASLVLALVTLVLGNLLLWRLTRRESQLVRLRADFVDVVSHELRTPLTALSLKAEMLASGDVPAERRDRYLTALHQDVLRLTDQVERILDFGRLQKGAALRRELVPARTLLARGVKQGRPALRLVGQQLSLEAPRALPAIVGDVEVLGRALRNLLENAAKYAPPGSTVAVRAFARGEELVVEVADAGPGVPTADRAGIFQPFVRGSEAPSGTPGSGLGLALVAAAAATHGGRVTVADRPGGGAVFSITLPARRQEVS